MLDIKQFLSRRYLRLVDNLSESFLLSQSITTDWKTQRLLELMEQITTCIIYRESSLINGRTCDGKPEQPLDVQDIPTTEEEDVLHELRFERDCCSF